MKTKITLLDRIMISNTLPEKGGFTDLIVRKDIIEKLRITQEEIEKFQITTKPSGQVEWEKELTPDNFDFEFTKREAQLIHGTLKDLDRVKQLSPNHLGIYNIFVTEDDNQE